MFDVTRLHVIKCEQTGFKLVILSNIPTWRCGELRSKQQVFAQPLARHSLSNTMQQRLNGLKSRSDESRLQAAKDLQHYVSTELREASAEQYTSFMDELNHHIFEMVSSSDANEKKGGIMAIGEYYYYFVKRKKLVLEVFSSTSALESRSSKLILVWLHIAVERVHGFFPDR